MKTVIPVKSQRVEGADAKLLCTVGLQELGRSGTGVGLQSCAQSCPIDLLYVYVCLCTELLSAEQPHAHLCPCAAFRGSPCAHLPELHRALLPPSTPHGIPLQLWGLPGPAAQFPPGDPCSTALPIHPPSPPNALFALCAPMGVRSCRAPGGPGIAASSALSITNDGEQQHWAGRALGGTVPRVSHGSSGAAGGRASASQGGI